MGLRKLNRQAVTSWLLRVGLAFVFVYAAVASLQHPLEWVGYLPHFLTKMLTATTLLKIMSVYELLLSAWLLSGKYLKVSAGLAALTMIGIVLFNPTQLIITFRDVGLACMALALMVHGWEN